jgi:hypothetical protein
MTQKIFVDSGMMLDEGKTPAQFMAEPDWDPQIMQIVDTDQEFDQLDMGPPATGRVPENQKWFYMPSLNRFFLNTRRKHAIVAAAETLFTAERWEQILDYIDEQGDFQALLHRLDLKTARRKIQRARAKGLLTTDEVQDLGDLVAHLP